MQCFILAGGFATRLWPLTEKRAKPLLPVAGKPIIEYLLEKIPLTMPVTVSTNAAFEESFAQWTNRQERDVRLLIEESKKDDHKLGALGAVRQWVETHGIDEDVLLLTGDNYLGFSMEEFLEQFEPGIPLLAAFDIGSTEAARAFGTVIVDQNNPKNILGFEEKPAQPKTSLVSSGCCIIPRGTLPILLDYAKDHPDNVGGIFEEFLRRGLPVQCFAFTDHWLDIGSFGAYLAAHRLILGTQMVKADSAHCEDTETDGCVFIDQRSIVMGSHLEDCVIFEDCVIEDCVLKQCVIDRGCQLKGIDLTGKMLREGTTLVRDKG